MSSKLLNGKHLAADIDFITTPPAAKATLQTTHDVGVELTNVRCTTTARLLPPPPH